MRWYARSCAVDWCLSRLTKSRDVWCHREVKSGASGSVALALGIRSIGRPWRWAGDSGRPTWGQGYAFEAASACIDFAFDELGWDEVTHLIEDANMPSQTSLNASALRLVNTFICPGR